MRIVLTVEVQRRSNHFGANGKQLVTSFIVAMIFFLATSGFMAVARDRVGGLMQWMLLNPAARKSVVGSMRPAMRRQGMPALFA